MLHELRLYGNIFDENTTRLLSTTTAICLNLIWDDARIFFHHISWKEIVTRFRYIVFNKANIKPTYDGYTHNMNFCYGNRCPQRIYLLWNPYIDRVDVIFNIKCSPYDRICEAPQETWRGEHSNLISYRMIRSHYTICTLFFNVHRLFFPTNISKACSLIRNESGYKKRSLPYLQIFNKMYFYNH